MMLLNNYNSKIIKKYNICDLYDDLEIIKKRIKLINKLSNTCKCIPTTEFFLKDDLVLYSQNKIDKIKFEELDKRMIENFIYKLSYDLNDLSKLGFVHGDINFKNIIFSKNNIWLIDFEPSIRQLINGKVIFKTTRPYISIEDYKNKKISTQSDKIGWYFYCLRIFHNYFLKDRIKKFDDIRLSKSILPFNEKEFMKYDFLQITNKARDKINLSFI
jgi:hypothetical protein